LTLRVFFVKVVTLYSTLGIDALKYGINETEATHIITSGDQLVKIEVPLVFFFFREPKCKNNKN
jgi:hypothetical protein